MNRLATTTLAALATCAASGQAFAINNWQMNMLFQPSAKQLQLETVGRVMIFDGLTDTTVARAMDEQFDRIGNMMFTRIVITDDQGAARRDEDGNVMIQDDGC